MNPINLVWNSHFVFSFLVYKLRPRFFCYNSYNSSLLPDAPLMLVLEYAPYGDFLGYLRKSRGLEDKYYCSPECCKQEVTSYDLVSFVQQIASGMSFLASKKVRIIEFEWIIDKTRFDSTRLHSTRLHSISTTLTS